LFINRNALGGQQGSFKAQQIGCPAADRPLIILFVRDAFQTQFMQGLVQFPAIQFSGLHHIHDIMNFTDQNYSTLRGYSKRNKNFMFIYFWKLKTGQKLFLSNKANDICCFPCKLQGGEA
jgi:hypothetical protein